ncbi:MAG: hypothetical protein ACXWQQ_16710 [Pseudobdellovibrio sp.]
MRQTSLNLLFWIRKILLTSGYLSLIAIMAGADIKIKKTDLTLTSSSRPLPVNQCSASNALNSQADSSKNSNTCSKKVNSSEKNEDHRA